MTTTIQLSDSDYQWFTNLLREETGIELADGKRLMMEGRLNRRLAVLNLSTYREYRHHLMDRKSAELGHFVNAMTTNMTSFFRERAKLDQMISMCEARNELDTVFVWSAACSTGEEVYSIGMLFEQRRKQLPGFDYRILGTDIDTDCLRTAEQAQYPPKATAGLPSDFKERFFEPGRGQNLRVCSAIRDRTKFRRLNLLSDANSLPADFLHFVYLRNVLIYFSEATVRQIVQSISTRIRPGGALFLGASEYLDVTGTPLEKFGSSAYRRIAR